MDVENLNYSGAVMEKVVFPTDDSVFIAGDYYPGAAARSPALLLLHMMPADRKSWVNFAAQLQRAGYQVLAIDLRGHGESRKQGNRTIDYKLFYTDEEHKKSRLDVIAAAEFLRRKGVQDNALALAGASIGANLALQYLAEHPHTPAAALLSPGLEYHGVRIDESMQNLQRSQAVLLIASEEDSYSAESVDRLGSMGAADKEIKLYKGLGHGTAILEKDPSTLQYVVGWLKRHLPPPSLEAGQSR